MGRVLLVEDNPANQRLFQLVLESMGHSVEIAGTGEQGWSLLETAPEGTFAGVLLDMHLPGMDGFTLAGRIRERFGPGLPLIAVTALAMEGDRERVLASGCDECITKPISIPEFRARVGALLPEGGPRG